MQGHENELELADALASYFERKNNGEKIDSVVFIQQWPSVQDELRVALSLLQVAQNVPPTTTQEAWQRFKSQIFGGAAQPATTLGGYVAQALQQNDRDLRSTGLPRETLAALSRDNTPLDAIQAYQFDDYAQLAKRYQVKNDLFPRMLKWLKGVGKSLSVGSGVNVGGRGLAFARDETTQSEVTEDDLTRWLEDEE